MSEKIKHIAVMRLSAMGDVAMTVPVIRALAYQYPDLRITVISRPFFRPFFEGIPNLSFFTFDSKHRHKGFLGLLRLFSELKKENIDGFADLHNVLRSRIIRTLLRFSGIKTAFMDKGRAGKAALTRTENKIFKPLPSMFERHAQVFKKLDFPIDLSAPQFPPIQQPDTETINITGLKTQRWIGIAPFAQYGSKTYPFDLMGQLVGQLAVHQDYKIFLFGAKAEAEILETIAAKRENVINIAGKISFQQELQLIANLDIMLSMDSGNAHIAAMYGIKVITLWGATHPFAGFSPFNQPIENALVSDRTQFPKLPTSVYGNKIVDGYENAMRTITPEMIANKITALLQ